MPARTPFAYAAPLSEFLTTPAPTILGALTDHAASSRLWASTEHQQVRAWTDSIAWLQTTARDLTASTPAARNWTLCLEYEIPRRGSRIDALLLADDLIIVIEFKASKLDAAASRQAEDYAMELLDFHEASHDRPLFPVVCAGQATDHLGELTSDSSVASVSTCSPVTLAQTLLTLHAQHHQPERPPIVADAWLQAPYHPTPTIIESARVLYSGHDIRELAHSEANAERLRRTHDAVAEIVDTARTTNKETICFITGVPGAGKTLAGLNIVHGLPESHHATFLSGNGPLVKVLQAVLAQDITDREHIKKSEAKRRATTLVTNVHRWLDEYIDRSPTRAPHKDVVVFDEAQRAWNRAHSKRKFGRDASEPEMMLTAMSRRTPSVVIGLIGGGQEISTGEAGLSEWGRALTDRFADWDIVVSPELASGNPLAGSALFASESDIPRDRLRTHADLHLSVSQRSFRSQNLSLWVEQVLAGQPDEASVTMEHLQRYPIVMTRDLDVARNWLRDRTRGLRRCGLLASSGARRLRPDGISVKEPVSEVDWFLRPPEDIRASNFLELAITEFGIQGLEVDWAGLAWGGDLTRVDDEWNIRALRGTAWRGVHSAADRAYAINRYRVLLTRAREGMVLWIPVGHPEDGTRDPRAYQSVLDYLSRCGVRTI